MKKIRELHQAAIAAKIKARRLALGWTLAELGRRAGVSEDTCVRAENATGKTSAAPLVPIADALEVPLDELLYGEPGRFGKSAKLRLLELIASFDEDQAEILLPDAEAIREGLSLHPLSRTRPTDTDEGKKNSG